MLADDHRRGLEPHNVRRDRRAGRRTEPARLPLLLLLHPSRRVRRLYNLEQLLLYSPFY